MKKIWNYIFFSTWRSLTSLGIMVIERPIVYFFTMIPFFKNNWDKGKKKYNRYMHNKESGLNINFAFSFMFSTTMVIFTSICMICAKLFEIKVGDTIYYYFWALVALSYFTNYFALYQSDTYKTYFIEFEKTNNNKQFYITAILFHTSVIALGILSAYLTVGFDL
jgi:hypothetical protein